MAEVLGPVEHLCEYGYGFDLKRGAGAATVERVVVGVDRHGERVGGAGDGVRRFEHLPGGEGVGGGGVVVGLHGSFGAEWCGRLRAWGRAGLGEARGGLVWA